MKKVPLHADEMRIGYFGDTQKKSFPWWIVTVFLLIAVIIFFDLKAAKKIHDEQQKS
jgi:hypothetical protein